MFDIIKGTVELGEKLVKALQVLKLKITGDKVTAVGELNDAIDEILKFYDAAQDEITNFQSLDLSRPENTSANKRTLADIQSGKMQVRLAEASGSCHKIAKIYRNHLDTWFQQTFASERQTYIDLQHVFMQLSQYDLSMLSGTEELFSYLDPICDQLSRLMAGGDTAAAVSLHDETSAELLKLRKTISAVTVQLVKMRNEFAGLGPNG